MVIKGGTVHSSYEPSIIIRAISIGNISDYIRGKCCIIRRKYYVQFRRIYDTTTNKLIAACIVGLVNGLPYILDFVVHPEFQRKGLATKMMERTLDILSRSYPAIRLNITVGNDAEIFYNKLGFVSLVEKGDMKKSDL